MGQQYSHLSSEERILIEKLHCEQHLSIRLYFVKSVFRV